MSDLNNPLFDNQREFLERQKEEYKNALMGDVEHIKSHGQEIGKKVAMAGGVIVAGLLIKRMLTSSKKKAHKITETDEADGTIPVSHPIPAYDPIAHKPVNEFETEPAPVSDKKGKKAKNQKRRSKPGMIQTLINSPLAQTIALEGIALLVAYITKKGAEHMNTKAENNDIADKAVPATEADPVVQSVSDKHAI
jgi:hypothetical protein